jgi:hypothetical protein
MNTEAGRGDLNIDAPGFYYQRLYDSNLGIRVPPLDDPQLAWLRPIFTRRARYAMLCARIAVVRLQHPMLDLEHVLLGIVEATPPELFAPDGLSRDVLTAAIESIVSPGGTPRLEAIPVTDAVRHMVERASEEGRERGYDLIGIGPLLLSLTRETASLPSEILAKYGITYAGLRANLSPTAFVS